MAKLAMSGLHSAIRSEVSLRRLARDAAVRANESQSSAKSEKVLAAARSLTREAVEAWWNSMHGGGRHWPLRELPQHIRLAPLSRAASEQARDFGMQTASSRDAGYLLGSYYTAQMPKNLQSRLGAYYTPPALCERLLDLATEEGIDWRTARILDPACGGGAFLSPIARRMAASLRDCGPEFALKSIFHRLRGFELDPFAAWLSRVFLEASLGEHCRFAGMRADNVIEVCDSLECGPESETFDLVIGNPPYGRITLEPRLRQKYQRSLYGHANLYGVFTDLALRLCRPGGVIAFVTPASFLGGEYFKTLRGLLGREAPPTSIDFVSERKGVFTDVLQETVLAIYRKGARRSLAQVHFISPRSDMMGGNSGPYAVSAGVFQLPSEPERPWLVPRTRNDNEIVQRAERMPHRLAHYGYRVSTGPLVWNRHKAGLREQKDQGCYPLIWAESVRPDGSFEFRALKKNHKPWFRPLAAGRWVVTCRKGTVPPTHCGGTAGRFSEATRRCCR